MDPFDFETVMSRHLFEGGSLLGQNAQNHSSNSNSSNDYFLCEDSITDTDSFNSDQENNNEIKEWVDNLKFLITFNPKIEFVNFNVY